jgi:CsoR family transcriptional regulator, copper-sensing transcriptional repressor
MLGCFMCMMSSCGERRSIPPAPQPTSTVLPDYVKELTTAEAEKLLRTEPGLKVLDARHWDEMRTSVGFFSTAIACPEIQGADETIRKLDVNSTYLITCPLGERSRMIALKMSQRGFRKLYLLQGGLHAWIKEGRSLELKP